MSENKPGTLFGIPVVCSGDMPVFEADNLGIILADFKAGYKIVDKVGMFSLRDQYTEKPFVKFYTVKRVGGDVIVPDAIKVLKV
jgi:HK97 family phage major capsid protein